MPKIAPTLALSLCDNIPELMGAADMPVTKAGSGSICQSFIAGLLLALYMFFIFKFDQEFARFLNTQRRLQTLHRFRHHPSRCLRQLEHQWADAVRRKSR